VTDDEDRTPDQPQDRLIDRRSFLTRMSALSAAAGAATVLPPISIRDAVAAVGLGNDAYAQTIRPEALADPTELTLSEAATLIKKKQISPLELTQAYLERIAAFEGVYKAFNTIRVDDALVEAAAATSARNVGPLHGIPLGIKDNYYTAGTLTTANSYIFENFLPDFDATCVARLKAAGGIVLGKMQMGPLATTRATTPDGIVTTVNAWTPNNASTDPGGSSSGSATATAGRMVTSSIGTQTGGSITAPSNAQALTGLKPTVGRAPLYGIIPLTYTRDHPGPLARDAKDAAIMMQVMSGPDPNDPRTLGLPPVPDLVKAATPVKKGSGVVLRWPTTVGVIPNYLTGNAAAARTAMLQTFASLGATIVDVALPADWDLLTGGSFNNVRLPERSEPFLQYLKQDVRLFGVSLNSWMQGLFLGGEDYLKGQRAKFVLMQQVLDDLFSQCDVVVQTSPVPFDILGLPEIAFNIGFNTNSAGLPVPVGAILGGLPYAEDRLLSLAAAFQAVTEFHLKRPADPVVSPAARSVASTPLALTAEDVVELTE
jgi:Asp-tRNA(Asn)/Glu-tRNA(Gln) amidotransferase A subunit family amidase